MAAPILQLHPDEGPAPVEAPNPTEILPSPSNPLEVARILLQELTDDDGHLLLRKWRGDHYRYVGPQWSITDPEGLRKWLYDRLEFAKYEKTRRHGNTEITELVAWAPDKAKVDKLIDAMIAPTLLDRDVDAPTWLSTGESATGLVPCLNGLVDVHTQDVLPCSPDYFGVVAIPLEFDRNVGEPVEWLKFLRSVWPAMDDGQDAEELRTLRQWMGYVLSGRLDLQKMLLVIGPPRCGKGTIARILTELMGRPNVAAPTLAGLAGTFGLQPLLGKALAIVGDARLQSQGQETVVERLLSISGQDGITVDRKNRTAWHGTIPARVMVLSNDMPKFGDASGAIASRFVILRMEESFLGREDIDLEFRLRAELSSILKWALDGLLDLSETRRLHETAAHREAMAEMLDLVSPISAFVGEVCNTDEETATVPFAKLYEEYQRWCRENTRGAKNSAGFSSDLKSRLPGLKTDYRPRDEHGRKMPRHVRGLRIDDDWANRVQADIPWRGNGW